MNDPILWNYNPSPCAPAFLHILIHIGTYMPHMQRKLLQIDIDINKVSFIN